MGLLSSDKSLFIGESIEEGKKCHFALLFMLAAHYSKDILFLRLIF